MKTNVKTLVFVLILTLSIVLTGNVHALAVDAFSEDATYDATTKTFTLNNDVAKNVTIEAGEDYTIDLNGHEIINEDRYNTTIWVKTGGKLVLKNGTVSTVDNPVPSVIGNDGTLTLIGITATNPSTAVVPLITNNGTLTITSGTYTSDNVTSGRFTPVVSAKTGTTTINGGTFTQKGTYNTVQVETGTVKVNGGTFIDNSTGVVSVIGDTYGVNGTVKINGGTFTGKYAMIMFTGNAVVTDGTFNGIVANYTDADITISGGTFTDEVAGLLTNPVGNYDISGGTFKNEPAADTLVANVVSYELSNGTYKVGVTPKDYELRSAIDTTPEDDEKVVTKTEANENVLVYDVKDELEDADASDNVDIDRTTLDNVMRDSYNPETGDRITTMVSTINVNNVSEDTNFIKSIKRRLGKNDKTAAYYNIDISVFADGTYIGQVFGTSKALTFSVDVSDVPAVADGYERTWSVLRRIYNHEYDEFDYAVLDATVKNNILSFKSDNHSESTYAIIYNDVKKTSNTSEQKTTTEDTTKGKDDVPKTGYSINNILVYLVLGSLMLLTISLIKKEN